MDKAVLLAQLQSLLETAPDFSAYSPSSREHNVWLAKGHALIKRSHSSLSMEVIEFASASDNLHFNRDRQIAKIFNLIHRAIADLELDTPQLAGQVFAPGEPYDFFKALSAAVGSATKSIFIIDAYLDEQIFDSYISGLPTGVSVQLLTGTKHGVPAKLKPAVAMYNQQHGNVANVKISDEIHDRVLFIDNLSCWVMGQSIKDAAKAKPTYLLPLPTDIATLKLSHYELIWNNALAL
jgi:hypothetical protein